MFISALITSLAVERQITMALAFSRKYLGVCLSCIEWTKVPCGDVDERRCQTTRARVQGLLSLSLPFFLLLLKYYTCSRGKKLRINISLSGIRKLSRLYPANFRTSFLLSSLTYVSTRTSPRRGWLLRDLLYNFRLSLGKIEASSFEVTTKVSRRSWEIQLMKQRIVGRHKETRGRYSTTSITRHCKPLSLPSLFPVPLPLFLFLSLIFDTFFK